MKLLKTSPRSGLSIPPSVCRSSSQIPALEQHKPGHAGRIASALGGLWSGVMLSLVLGMTGSAQAQLAAYPTRPVRVVVGFAPGGNTDVAARIVARKAGELLGQQVVVENRPGAGGSLAAEAVVLAPADGYTLLVGTLSTQVLNIGLQAKPRVRMDSDFAPVALTNEAPLLLGVGTSSGANTIAEFVARAKARSGSPINYGAPAVGGVGHLAAVMFNRQAGVQAEAVVYKGSSAAVIDLAAGRIDYLFDGFAVLAPQLASGRVALLGISGQRRHPDWPQLPTFAEAGYPELSKLMTWNAWFAPARTPRPIVEQLNRALLRALADPEVLQALKKTGNEVPPALTPAQLNDFLADERRRWLPVIRQAGIQPE